MIDIQNQTCIGLGIGRFGILSIKVAGIIVDLQFRLDRYGMETRTFDIGFQIHRLIGLHPHHQFIPGTFRTLE